jgi:hypothetical protein
MLIASRILQGWLCIPNDTQHNNPDRQSLPQPLGDMARREPDHLESRSAPRATLSGIIIDMLGWRWIYLFYVPMGFAALIWSMRTLIETYKPPQKACLNIPGFLLFT